MVDAIFHLADIHIRMLRRHDEYDDAFEELFLEAKRIKNKYKNPIAVIAGDIVHAKIDISPELISMVSKFIEGLSNILPVYVYPGNHDANLNNGSRLDTLGPIIRMISKYNNVKYIKHSDVIEFENIRLIHYSVFDPIESYPPIKQFDNSKLNFAIYHGAVDNSYTAAGFKLESKTITNSLFNGFDGVLLGDIHNRQCLQKREHNRPEIWYPGSFVQQDHGESLDGHGGLIWEIDNDINVKPWDIKHDYGYVTIDITDGKYKLNNNIPKKPRIRLNVKNTDLSSLNKIKSDLRGMFDVKHIQTQKQKFGVSDKNIESLDLGNMSDVEYQNTMIKDYLSLRYKDNLNESEIEKIINLNREINKNISIENKPRGINWKIKYFEYSNLLSYGEDNIIDFTNLNGNIGLFAPNTFGKSSLLDSILFALFDKTARTNSPNLIINNKKNDLYSKIVFEIDGIDYTIEKHGKKSKSGSVKVTTNFTKNDNGSVESLNGDDKRQTNKIIENYIGTFDDFILTAFSTQNSDTNFIDLKQAQRKQTLYQFLDITIFESLFDTAKEDSRDLKKDIAKIKSSNISEKYSTNKSNYNKIISELENLKVEEEKIKREVDFEKNEMSTLRSRIKNVEDLNINIDYINSNINDVKSEINILSDNLNSLKQSTHEASSSYSRYNDLVKHDNIDELNQKNNLYNNLKLKQSNIESNINSLGNELKILNDNLEHIQHNEFNPDCDVCQSNNLKHKEGYNKLITKIEVAKKQIIENKTLLGVQKQEISDVNFSDDYYTKYVENFNLYAKYQDIYFGSKEEIDIISNKIKTLSNKLDSLKSQYDKYYENEDTIKFNKELNSKILLQEEKVNIAIKSENQIILKINELYKQSGYYEQEIKSIENTLDDLKQKEEKYKVYEYYLKSVSKDGLPKDIVDKTLPKIEQEVNRILEQLVDFRIMFDVSENSIDAYLAYADDDFWLLDLSSGMERFISSLAIRVAMINVTNLPKPNFIAIDEGWGTLSSEHLNNLFMLLDYLKSEFEFTLIISHLELMRDMVDNLIDITKVDKFSKINI